MSEASKHKKLNIGLNVDYKLLLCYVLTALLPFIMVMLLLFLNGYEVKLTSLLPAWNDEVGWWNQVNSMIHYGKPLGYNGYNGTHAEVGTWGPWGWAPMIPYFLFGKIFGWQYYSMAIANITFLSLAIAVFLVLTQPSIKQTLLLAFVYITSFITINYSFTSMSEGLRYSLGIILVGLFIRLERKTRDQKTPFSVRDIILFVILSAFVYYAIMVYMIFALVVPLFCLCFFRRLKPLPNIAISIAATLAAALSANSLVSRFCAPYTVNTINDIISTIKNDGLYKGICYMLDTFFANLNTVNLSYTISALTDALIWYYVLYVFLLVFLIISAFGSIKDVYSQIRQGKNINGSDVKCLTACYLMLGFLCGYCLLYTGDDWTLCRGINTGMLMALFCLIFVDNKKLQRAFKLLAAWFLMASVCIWDRYGMITSERAEESRYSKIIKSESEILDDIIIISEDNDAWENTVAHYGNVNSCYLALPAGTGMNFMIDISANEHAAYAVITASNADAEQIMSMLIENGHEVIHRDRIFIVLKNNNMQ